MGNELPLFEVTLPTLKRPAGWTVLDSGSVRTRAAKVYLAYQHELRTTAEGAIYAPAPGEQAVALLEDDLTTGVILDADGSSGCPAIAIAPADTVENEGMPKLVQARRLLPWALLLGGVVLAPWLIWAPLLGGLSFGLLLIQTGLLQRWLDARPYADTSEVAEAFVPALIIAGEPRDGEHRRGWLLLAVLILFVVQCLMLITTLKIKAEDPTIAIRAAGGESRGREELRQQLGTRQSEAKPIDAVLPPVDLPGPEVPLHNNPELKP